MNYTIRQFKTRNPQKIRLASGEDYGLLIMVQGSAYLNSKSGSWRTGTEDLVLFKPNEIAGLEYTGGKFPLQALWVRISAVLMEQMSTDRTCIQQGFDINPNQTAIIRPGSKSLMLIKNLVTQLYLLENNQMDYCKDILEEGLIKMFLALVLRGCASQDRYVKKPRSGFSLDGVFSYINAHLTEDLTLDRLEKEFYVSSSYLNKEFKRRTGQTVHRYITKVRLDLCRRYLEDGYSSSQIYRMVGFGGYNHYFKAFKKEYGMTPKEYLQSIRQQMPGKDAADGPAE